MFWTVAFAVGLVGGFAAVLFRFSVSSLQEVFYQTDEITLVSKIHDIPWAWLLLLPVLGGLSVGLILHFFSGENRNGSVSDVIEGATINLMGTVFKVWFSFNFSVFGNINNWGLNR